MKIINVILISTLLWSCQEGEQSSTVSQTKEEASISPKMEFENKAHELVYTMVQKVGNYEALQSLKDVVYTYTYQTADNKADVSTEKYIFDGELSYAAYEKHERTLPALEGKIEQGFDGSSFWFQHNGERLEEEEYLNRAKFSRKTNFYWFAMLQKLLDPGLNYDYIKEETIEANQYDVVKVSFDSDKPTDIYQLYINKKTGLVDQFLFTVADFNVMETPFLMRLEYEEINGILIPNKRKYGKADWNAVPVTENWTMVSWTDIKFDNGLTKAMFE